MREILFRAKRLEDDKWTFGGVSFDIDHNIYIVPARFSDFDNEYAVHPETLGQFTGKCDKDGKKIFEGDIVNRVADNENGLIVWDDKRCGFYIKPLSILGRAMYDPYYKMNANKLEVVGNIHDNPELLSNN